MADDFTVERAVNLSQLDSWADISKFQWQEIDHGIQDNLGFYLFHPKNNVLPSYVAWIAVNDVPNNALTLEFDESETTSLTPVPGLTPDPSPLQRHTLLVRERARGTLKARGVNTTTSLASALHSLQKASTSLTDVKS